MNAPPTPTRTLRIGITGPIGCGKSTISAALRWRGAIVVDADALARQVTPPGSAAFRAIRGRFGPEVVTRNGRLDRAALARIVFSDPAALRDLEAIIHPAVRLLVEREVEAAESGGEPFVVVEAIKLVEAGYAAQCDEVWLVVCSSEEQRARLAGRGFPPDEMERRIAAQGHDLVARLRPSATRIIDSAGSPEDAVRRADTALDAAFANRSWLTLPPRGSLFLPKS